MYSASRETLSGAHFMFHGYLVFFFFLTCIILLHALLQSAQIYNFNK